VLSSRGSVRTTITRHSRACPGHPHLGLAWCPALFRFGLARRDTAADAGRSVEADISGRAAFVRAIGFAFAGLGGCGRRSAQQRNARSNEKRNKKRNKNGNRNCRCSQHGGSHELSCSADRGTVSETIICSMKSSRGKHPTNLPAVFLLGPMASPGRTRCGTCRWRVYLFHSRASGAAPITSWPDLSRSSTTLASVSRYFLLGGPLPSGAHYEYREIHLEPDRIAFRTPDSQSIDNNL